MFHCLKNKSSHRSKILISEHVSEDETAFSPTRLCPAMFFLGWSTFPLRVRAGNFVTYTRGPLHCPHMTTVCRSDFPWPKEKWIVSSVFLLNSWHKAGIRRRTGEGTNESSQLLVSLSLFINTMLKELTKGMSNKICVCNLYIFFFWFCFFSLLYLVDWR